MALIKCKACGHQVSKQAKTCPNCGHILKRGTHGCAWMILVLLVIGGLVVVFSGYWAMGI